MVDPAAHLVEIDDEFFLLQQSCESGWQGRRRHLVLAPAPVRRQFQRAIVIGQEEHARRAVGNVCQCLDGALRQARLVEACAADGVGEPYPLGPVIVTVLE